MFEIDDGADELLRLPGLYRVWDVPQLLRPGQVYRIEEAGATADGTPLYAVWTGPDLAAGEGTTT